MIDDTKKNQFDNAVFIISALISGFFLIPVHELGHVICHWLSGNPAGMSYARDYMLFGGEFTLFGVSGGLVFPLLISIIFLAIIMIKKRHQEILVSFAILGCSERSIQYLSGQNPSDEKIIAKILSIEVNVIKFIFILFPLAIIGLLVFALRKNGLKNPKILFIFRVTLLSYILMAIFGIFVMERFVFPAQYHIQFG